MNMEHTRTTQERSLPLPETHPTPTEIAPYVRRNVRVLDWARPARPDVRPGPTGMNIVAHANVINERSLGFRWPCVRGA